MPLDTAVALDCDLGVCKLRPWRKSDRFALTRHANDPSVAVQMMALMPYPFTDPDADRLINWATSNASVHHVAIVAGGFAVGGAGVIMGEGLYAQTADLGYWLNSRFRGKGIARRAVYAVTHHAFAQLGARRVAAYVFSHNEPSIKLLRNLGFSFEGCLREVLVRDGQPISLQMWSMLASDLPQPQFSLDAATAHP